MLKLCDIHINILPTIRGSSTTTNLSDLNFDLSVALQVKSNGAARFPAHLFPTSV